jgi:hypothetical protein
VRVMAVAGAMVFAAFCAPAEHATSKNAVAA